MTSKLIEALNKCETRKSYENVRYTLVDDELRDYIEESLERLEALEKLVYTNQFENTKNIENEFGRAFTILQNHCVAMEDTLYASKVLIQLISKYEKLKKIIKENFWTYNKNEVLFRFNENTPVMQEEIKEVLGK